MNNVSKVLEEYAEKLASVYKQKLQGSKDTGKLISSIKTEVKKNDTNYEVVLHLEDYWKWIEDGRPAGKFPPTSNILKWIQTKNIMPKPYTLPSGKQVVPSNMQLAFLIGRKIATEGYKGNEYLSDSLKQIQDNFIKDLSEAFGKDIMAELLIEFRQ